MTVKYTFTNIVIILIIIIIIDVYDNFIIPVKFESAVAQDEEETWNMTYQQKKDLFGSSNRIRVGGEKPDGESEKSFFVAISLWKPHSFHQLGVILTVNPINESLKHLKQPPLRFSYQGCFDQHVPSRFPEVPGAWTPMWNQWRITPCHLRWRLG